jgi:hypothetical protein
VSDACGAELPPHAAIPAATPKTKIAAAMWRSVFFILFLN